jgi:putative ABC transport system permease protein
MFKNYLKIAFRNLLRHKHYSAINILGLSIGIAACIIMLVYIQEELSYDEFHVKADRIFRITDEWTSGAGSEDLATAPFPVGRVLQLENPAVVENVVRLFQPSRWGNATVISFQDQSFVEDGLMFADSSFFSIFNFEFIQGSHIDALNSPSNIVITEEIAQKYFGKENAIGKRLILNNAIDFEIAGVLKSIPQNSHIQFDLITSMGALRNWWGGDNYEQGWVWQAVWTYVLLKDADAAKSIQEQLPDFVQRHFPESVKHGSILTMQPIKDIHLKSQRYLEIASNGNILYVYIFSAIAVLILFIACINFMNLATARSANRVREVGLRKVLGAYRFQLILQFLGESILLSLTSLLFAIAVIELALPIFNSLSEKSLSIHYLENPFILIGLFSIGLLVGIISGSYPALYLSGFRPISILKGYSKRVGYSGRTAVSLRKVLVVGQFIVSLVLLICISVIFNQLNFLKNKELGLNKEQVIFFPMMGNVGQQFGAFKEELILNKDILAVSVIGGSVPGSEDGIANAFIAEGIPPESPKWFGMMAAVHDIVEVMGLEIIAGRQFSEDFPSDPEEAFVINETALQELGWPLEEAIGKKLERVRSDGTVSQSGKVIAVVRDFHFEPLHEELKPLVIRFGGGLAAVRIHPHNINATIAHIENTWEKFAPEWPLTYNFLDENMDNLYRREQKLSEVLQYFTFLAIFIACLGLFGLASFTAEQRTKEIGIRKVLGASVSSLFVLLCREFTKLILLAFIVAVPIAYFAMNRWLENFAYRIDIGIWIFLLSGIIALLITIATVGFQAIKAARANPINSLRYE